MYAATRSPTSSSTSSPPATRSRTCDEETASGRHRQELDPRRGMQAEQRFAHLLAPEPVPLGDRQAGKAQQPLRLAPARQRARRVGPHDERQLDVGMLVMDGLQGIHRVGHAATLDLPARGRDAGALGDGQATHREPLIGAGVVAIDALVRRRERGHQRYLLQAELGARVPRQREMPDMRRVEGPAQYPDLFKLGYARRPGSGT